MIKPTIVIKIDNHLDNQILIEILAGIEEESVLAEVVTEKSFKPAHLLAQEAAEASQLEVGIGICKSQAVLTTHKIRGKALLHTNTDYRTLGQNAARYVKGNSFTQMIGGEL